MPVWQLIQARTFMVVALTALWCLGAGVCVSTALLNRAYGLRHPAVSGSAAITIGWMFLAWFAMSRSAPVVARMAWSLGLLMLFAHIMLAFGVAHSWSHAAAVEHVREVGGSREGIAVNYLFAIVWLVDVVWWWAYPGGYAARPRLVGCLIHGFMLFVVINATVVFGPPERRWWYGVALGVLGLAHFARPRPASRRG